WFNSAPETACAATRNRVRSVHILWRLALRCGETSRSEENVGSKTPRGSRASTGTAHIFRHDTDMAGKNDAKPGNRQPFSLDNRAIRRKTWLRWYSRLEFSSLGRRAGTANDCVQERA